MTEPSPSAEFLCLPLYNEAAAPARPKALFCPETPEAALAAFARCRAEGHSVSLYCTGHDFEGRSLSGDAVIKMSGFREACYDPVTARLTVGGGARVTDVVAALSPHGRAISTGTSQDVGIAGLALGGGAAYTSRRYGLTCDSLVGAELCTFGGERLWIDDDTEPQLMRLLRGAGGGWLGAVTRLVFDTYATEPVTTFSARWPLAAGRGVIKDLETALIAAPDVMSMRIGANIAGSSRDACITLSGQIIGGEEALVERHLGPMTRDGCLRVRVFSYNEAMVGARHVTAGGAFKIKSRFAEKAIDAEGLAELLDHLGGWSPTANPDGAGFALFAWGGAIRRMDPARSCAGGRQAEYLASFDTSWEPEATAGEIDEQLEWVDRLDHLAAQHMSSSAYVNFPDSCRNGFSVRHLAPFADDLSAAIQRCDPYRLGRQATRCRSLDRPSRQIEGINL